MHRRKWYLLLHIPVAGWIVALTVMVIAHRFLAAAMWSMVHYLVLGLASTLILIWSQHFADTIFRRKAPGGRKFLAARIATFTAGAVAVCAGMAADSWPIVLAGAVVVVAAVIMHIASLGIQSRGALSSRFRGLVSYYVAAGCMLIVGVSLGTTIANDGVQGVLRENLRLAHLSVNLLGWLGITALGTLFLLWPTVIHARISEQLNLVAKRALPLLILGVLLAAGAVSVGVYLLAAIGYLLYVAGIVAVAIEMVRQLKSAPRNDSFATFSLGAALIWLAGSVLTFVFAALSYSSDEAAFRAVLDAMLPATLAGFVAQLILGALSYLLPVVLGGGPVASRAAANELNRAGFFRILVVNLGIAVYLLPMPSLVRVIVSLLVFFVLLSFVVLAVRAIAVSKRLAGLREAPAPKQPSNRPIGARVYSGMATAAIGLLALAVTAGIALDPAAAGIDTQGGGAVSTSGHTTTVEVVMKDLRFSPDTITVPNGDQLIIKLTNADDMTHDLTLDNGKKSPRLAPGQSYEFDAGVISRTLDGWCSIAGHRQLGMVMKVIVEGDNAQGPATGNGDSSQHDHGAADGPSAAEDIDLMKKPDAGFAAFDPTLLPAPTGEVHRYTFDVTDELLEVAPGIKQTLWTYNKQVPGPTLRGNVGDRFEVTLINSSEMGHSIDFHAGELAPDEPMRTIGPGESLVYKFTATHSGSWLYHCSTMPMSQHIANGMFGAVIIDPPALDPVDKEFMLVQSEFYLGPQNGVADLDRIASRVPDLMAFNGYANQYVYDPIKVKTGERVRIWLVAAGPNTGLAFHVIGGQFTTTYKEGDYLLYRGGSTGTGASQVLDLSAAQGGFVELTFPEAGHYSFVSHVMSDAEVGASGVFEVTD